MASIFNGDKAISWRSLFYITVPILLALIAYLSQMGINNVIKSQEKLEVSINQHLVETRLAQAQILKDFNVLCQKISEHDTLLKLDYKSREAYYSKRKAEGYFQNKFEMEMLK